MAASQEEIEQTASSLHKTIRQAKLYIVLSATSKYENIDPDAETKYHQNITKTLHTLKIEEDIDKVVNFPITHQDIGWADRDFKFSALGLAQTLGALYARPLSQKIANARLYLAVINNNVARIKALIKAYGCNGNNLLDYEQIYPLTQHNTILAIASGTRCPKTLMRCPEICILLLEAGASIKPYYGRTLGGLFSKQASYIFREAEKIINGHALLNIIRSLNNEKLTQMAESAAKEKDGILKKHIPVIIMFQFRVFQCMFEDTTKSLFPYLTCQKKRN